MAGVIMGAGEGGPMRRMHGKGKGKFKGKGQGMPWDSMMGGDMPDMPEGFKKLMQMLQGGQEDKKIGDMLKTLFSDDGPSTDRIKEVMDVFNNMFNKLMRRKRQADDGESMFAPKYNCVSNKANDGCLCCCNWHLPDRENNKCVDVEESLKAFVKDFVKMPPRGPPTGLFSQHLSSHVLGK